MSAISNMGTLTPGVSNSLFTTVDRNGDGQLTAGEFTEFLNTLIGNLSGGHSTGGLGSAATAIAQPAGTAPIATQLPSSPAQAGAAGEAYANIPGFDFGKLSNPAYSSAKYTPAVRVFSAAIAAGNLQPGTESLGAIVAYAKAHGFDKAAVTGGDSIDFGDGAGAIDVVTNSKSGRDMGWWFNGQAAPAQSHAPAGLTYADVLGKTNTYANSKWGRGLTDAEIASAKHDLGFTEGALIDPANLGTIQRWVDAHPPASARQA
jgi:hypothetical protein